MRGISAGQRDRLVELRHVLLTENDSGEEVESWPTAYATAWAKKDDLSGSKRFLAQQFSHDQLTQFQILWRDDVSTTDRLVLDGSFYEITQVAEVGRREGLDLLCRKIAA